MSTEERKVPELRFKGFNDDWEQRKLGEISFKVSEKNKNNLIIETFTNSAEFGIINQREFFSKDISNEKNLNNYYVVKPDDFVYNPRISNQAPVGPIKRNKLDRVGVMSPLYYVFRLHEDVDYDYLEYYFQSTRWHKFMKLNGDSGARSDRFSIKNSVLVTMPIPYPSTNEQHRIGKIFEQLNNVIHLHQRKINMLSELKKAHLREMFVDNVNKVPNLRFKDFKKEWEQRTISSKYSVTMGQSPSGENYTSNPQDHILVQGNADISNGWVSPRVWTTQVTKLIEPGNILLSVRAPVGQVGKTLYPVVIGRGIASLDGDEFVFQLLKRMQLNNYWRKVSTGSTFESISSKDINNALIKLPIDSERESIGEFLKSLDSYTELHQRKLNQLEKLKSSYLQKMFL